SGDAFVRLPGAFLQLRRAFLAGGNNLTVGVAPAQPGVLVSLKLALPQAQAEADVRPGPGIGEAISPADEFVGAQGVRGKKVLGVKDDIVGDTEPGVEILLV